jgi:hypothetical protein
MRRMLIVVLLTALSLPLAAHTKLLRRFPPPWTVEQIPGGYKVKDARQWNVAAKSIKLRTAGPIAAAFQMTVMPCLERVTCWFLQQSR